MEVSETNEAEIFQKFEIFFKNSICYKYLMISGGMEVNYCNSL